MRNSFSLIYFPAFLLTLLLSCSTVFFDLARTTLLLNSTSPFNPNPFLTIIPQIIVILSLLVASTRVTYDRLFKSTLMVLSVLVAITAFLTLYKSEWTTLLFYFSSSALTFPLFYVLIWGWINYATEKKEGIQSYLLVAFLLGLASIPAPFIKQLSYSWSFPLLVLSGLLCLSASWFLFHRYWNAIPTSTPNDAPPIKVLPRFPFFSAAYVLAGCIIANLFLSLVFKSRLVAQAQEPSDYSNLMGSYSLWIGISSVIFSLIWVFVGKWLLQKKGWWWTAACGSLVSLITTLLFVTFTYPQENFWWINGLHRGLLTATTTTLFFSLIQIAYLSLPQEKRFNRKLITELIVAPLLKGSAAFVPQALIVFYGSFNTIATPLKILSLIALIILLPTSKRVANRLANHTNQQNT